MYKSFYRHLFRALIRGVLLAEAMARFLLPSGVAAVNAAAAADVTELDETDERRDAERDSGREAEREAEREPSAEERRDDDVERLH